MKLNCIKINSSFEHDSPADFLQSQWQTREKSVIYLIYRWSVAFFFMFSVAVSMTTSALRRELHIYFIYLTHWNLIFTMISMVMNSVLVSMHHMERLKVTDKMTRELKILWFFTTSSQMYAFLVSLIYWTVLYKQGQSVIDFNNVLIHGTNSLIIVIDLIIVKQKARVGMFIYPLFCGFAFLFFTWLYPALGGLNR